MAHVPNTDTWHSGVWTSSVQINGIPYAQVSRFKADGTFTSKTVSGGIVLDLTGRYTNANGIATLVYDNGWFEQDSIVWVNPNQTICTCLRSNVPGAVGLQLVSNRLR